MSSIKVHSTALNLLTGCTMKTKTNSEAKRSIRSWLRKVISLRARKDLRILPASSRIEDQAKNSMMCLLIRNWWATLINMPSFLLVPASQRLLLLIVQSLVHQPEDKRIKTLSNNTLEKQNCLCSYLKRTKALTLHWSARQQHQKNRLQRSNRFNWKLCECLAHFIGNHLDKYITMTLILLF